MAADDIVISLYERDPAAEWAAPEQYPKTQEPVAIATRDFAPQGSDHRLEVPAAHAVAVRSFSLAGRWFDLWVEFGADPAPAGRVEEANRVLAGLDVEDGDFYPGSLEPARFSEAGGWFVGTSGSRQRGPDNEFATAWAATIPYRNGPYELPPFATLEALPRDGILIWVSLFRTPLFAPRWQPVPEPFRLDDAEVLPIWEGQVRDIPEYRIWTQVRGQYEVDLRVYFGRPDPTAEMLASAQAMLDLLELPDWGPWPGGTVVTQHGATGTGVSEASTPAIDVGQGIAVEVPPGWTLASEPLTPALADARELFSVGTYPLQAGGKRCAQVPEQALEDLGPWDALVSVQEREERPTDEFVARPAHFGPTLGIGYEQSEIPECLDPPRDFFLRWIPFQDQRRAFYALVAIGNAASSETRAEAWAILDGLQVEPR